VKLGARHVARFLFGCAVWLASPACSDWPPKGDSSDDNDNGGATSNTSGTCAGTPIPCSGLSASLCAATAGCLDEGLCAGSGFACDTARSPALCAEAEDCFWTPACTGSPIGNCHGVTEASCKSNPGCTWSAGTSSGGSTSTSSCNSFNTLCALQSDCTECGFTCIQLVSSVSAVCAKSCRTDNDCKGTTGGGTPTPYCVRIDPSSVTGACSQSRG
jgi:hypothetical protein